MGGIGREGIRGKIGERVKKNGRGERG